MTLLVGGESLPAGVGGSVGGVGRVMINQYGPTGTTVDVAISAPLRRVQDRYRLVPRSRGQRCLCSMVVAAGGAGVVVSCMWLVLVWGGYVHRAG